MDFFTQVTKPSKGTQETLVKKHEVWNKGLKGVLIVSEETLAKKRGQVAWNKGLKGSMSENNKASLLAANLGRKRSAETLAKLRAANLGRVKSAETLAKFRQSRLGHAVSAETRAKLRAANLGRKFGPLSTEQRLKLRAAHATPVMTYYGVYPSVRAVAEAAGVSAKVVSGWMKRFPKHYYYVV